jgi:hypothetical protein
MNPRRSILMLSCWIAAAPASGDTSLFRAADPAEPEALVSRLPETMLRDNLVSLDASQVVNDGRGAPELTLELFPDVELRATLNRFEMHGKKTFHWHGRAVDDFASMVVLTVADGRLFGSVVHHGRRYAIAWLPSGNYSIHEVDLEALPLDEPTHPRNDAPIALKSNGPRPGFAFGKFLPDVEVMVLWSNEIQYLQACQLYSQLALGGILDCFRYVISYPAVDWAAIIGDVLIPHAIAESNFVFANSGLGTPLNLVHQQGAAYAGAGDHEVDLARLANTGDGYLEYAPAVRDGRKADLVMLVTYHHDANWCGIAQGPPSIDPSNSSIAYGVVSARCLLNGNFTFVHELAHLFGAQHDWYAWADLQIGGTGMPPRNYAHGYTRMPEGLMTIMAYPNECEDENGWLCKRVPFFSDGGAWGRPETDPRPANNAKLISEALWTVSGYR